MPKEHCLMSSCVCCIHWTELYCRVNPDLRTFNAAEALRWLMQHKGIQQREAKQTLALLQQTHQISVVDKDLDLSNELSEADLSTTHLQLVNAAPVPQFGQPLNKHYTW